MEHITLKNENVLCMVREMHGRICHSFPEKIRLNNNINIYPVPRGGIPVAYALQQFGNYVIVDSPNKAHAVIDDLIDSGATLEKHYKRHGGIPFFALFDKRKPKCEYRYTWVTFPWESAGEETGFEDNVVRLLQYIGEDPTRGGLKETPKRVAKAWKEWCSGYNKKPGDILKCFEDGAEGCDQMVVVKDIPFYTHCEHHLAPFFGTATVAYIPNKSIVGLSKISRVVDMYARRLQVQERLTNQVANAIDKHLKPLGVGVTIKARHLCMESRGTCQQGHHTITTALRGVIKEDLQARAEFLGTI